MVHEYIAIKGTTETNGTTWSADLHCTRLTNLTNKSPKRLITMQVFFLFVCFKCDYMRVSTIQINGQPMTERKPHTARHHKEGQGNLGEWECIKSWKHITAGLRQMLHVFDATWNMNTVQKRKQKQNKQTRNSYTIYCWRWTTSMSTWLHSGKRR